MSSRRFDPWQPLFGGYMPLSVLVSYRRDREELIATVLLEMLIAGNFDFDDLIKARRDLPSQMPPAYSALPECLDDLTDTAQDTIRRLKVHGLGIARTPEEAGAVRDMILAELGEETAQKVRARWRFPKHLLPPGEMIAAEAGPVAEVEGVEALAQDAFTPMALVEKEEGHGPLPPPVEFLPEVGEDEAFESHLDLRIQEAVTEEFRLDDDLLDPDEFDFSSLDDVEAPAESEITRVISVTDLESRLPVAESDEETLPQSGLSAWDTGTPRDEEGGLPDPQKEQSMSSPEADNPAPVADAEPWQDEFGSEQDLLHAVADELAGDRQLPGASHIIARDPLERRVVSASELQALFESLEASIQLPLGNRDSAHRLLDWWEEAMGHLQKLAERWSHEKDGAAGVAVSGAALTHGLETLLALLGRGAQVMDQLMHRLQVSEASESGDGDMDSVEQVFESLATLVTVIEHLSEGRGFTRDELAVQFADQPSVVEALSRLSERAKAWNQAQAPAQVVEKVVSPVNDNEMIAALRRQVQEMDEESRHLRILAAWGRLRALLAELRYEVAESVKARGVFKAGVVSVHDRPDWMRRQWEDIHRYMGVLQNKLPAGSLDAEAAQISELAAYLEN